MEKQEEKQFSISFLVRLLLAILITASIIAFASSIMQYNQLLQKEKELQIEKERLSQNKENLEMLLEEQQEVESGVEETSPEEKRNYIEGLLEYLFGDRLTE